ncbi:MAG: hypothetical protein FJY65_09905 [Calditrichaeota bacterium]|nr:hypothetical protein [Calditrichota bacterium]
MEKSNHQTFRRYDALFAVMTFFFIAFVSFNADAATGDPFDDGSVFLTVDGQGLGAACAADLTVGGLPQRDQPHINIDPDSLVSELFTDIVGFSGMMSRDDGLNQYFSVM